MFSNRYRFCPIAIELFSSYRFFIEFSSICSPVDVELCPIVSIVVEIIFNCSRIVQFLSKFSRTVDELWMCFRIFDMFSNCSRVDLESSRFFYRIFVETTSYYCRTVQLLTKFNYFLVKLSNCYRNFGELLLKGGFAFGLLSNCS